VFSRVLVLMLMLVLVLLILDVAVVVGAVVDVGVLYLPQGHPIEYQHQQLIDLCEKE